MSEDNLVTTNDDFLLAISYTFEEYLLANSDVRLYVSKYLESTDTGETNSEKQLTVLLLLESGMSAWRVLKYLQFKVERSSVLWSKAKLEQVKEEGAFHLEMLDSVGGH